MKSLTHHHTLHLFFKIKCCVEQLRPPPHNGHSAAPCKNHDLCTKSLTLIEYGFTLCILYVRNGERYGGLRIRAGEHRRSISIRPISRTQSRKMREDFSGEDQWRQIGSEAARPSNGDPCKGGHLGRDP